MNMCSSSILKVMKRHMNNVSFPPEVLDKHLLLKEGFTLETIGPGGVPPPGEKTEGEGSAEAEAAAKAESEAKAKQREERKERERKDKSSYESFRRHIPQAMPKVSAWYSLHVPVCVCVCVCVYIALLGCFLLYTVCVCVCVAVHDWLAAGARVH